MESVDVPIDVYDSTTELVVVMPLWWVAKKSISIDLQGLSLIVTGERKSPQLKETLLPSQEHCFWWTFVKKIVLPENTNFGQIHSQLTAENILLIVVPKVVTPEKIMVQIT